VGSVWDYTSGKKSVGDAAKQLALYLGVPYGGGQLKKTVEGTAAAERGYAETSDGRVKYPIHQSAANALRAALFGPSAVPEAREYYNEDRRPLSKAQSARIERLPAAYR
jgi:hypothetical protein